MNPNDIDNNTTPEEDDNTDENFWFEAPGGDKENQPPEDAPDYNFRDDARRAYMIVGSILAVFVFIAVLWYLYYQKNSHDAEEPPLITAEEGPIRERPDDPGGMEVPHQDKLIFDVANGEKAELEDAVQPGPEQPLEEANDRTIEDLIEENEPTPVSEPVKMADLQTQPVVTEGYAVQLGAFSERRIAEEAWQKIQTTHWQLLAEMESAVDTVTTSTGRVLYRLRIGDFETQADATRLCGQLKQRGQDCLVTKR